MTAIAAKPPISVQELAQRYTDDRSVQLIDVRTPVEFRTIHIPFARNHPLHSLDPATMQAGADCGEAELYVICHSGSRGQQAVNRLRAAGINAVNVDGGTTAWEAAGLPVVRGKRIISLERQVRIAAGSLVLVSLLLSWTVSPYWLGLAAFVGSGLIFAGITDWCGMGLLLAWMPWTRDYETKRNNSGPKCSSTTKCSLTSNVPAQSRVNTEN